MFFLHLGVVLVCTAVAAMGANLIEDSNRWISATGVVMALGGLYGICVMISLAPDN